MSLKFFCKSENFSWSLFYFHELIFRKIISEKIWICESCNTKFRKKKNWKFRNYLYFPTILKEAEGTGSFH